MRELYAIVRPYPDQIGNYFCYKCHERIKDDVEFSIHIMKEKGIEFRHYHLECSPKTKIAKILSFIKHRKRINSPEETKNV